MFEQMHELYATNWGKGMVTLSFSEAIMVSLEQERAKGALTVNYFLTRIDSQS